MSSSAKTSRLLRAATQREIDQALYRRQGKNRLDLETQIVKGCIDWLNTVPHVRAWRQNTGAREWLDERGRKRIVHFGQPGQADITGIAHGLRLEIEVKRPGEKPSSEQYGWLFFIDERKGIAFWCDSLDRCQRQLKDSFRRLNWHWDVKWEV